jgi:hypothetical protein
VAELRSRPEGFADGERLIAGRPHQQLVPQEGAPEEGWK